MSDQSKTLAERVAEMRDDPAGDLVLDGSSVGGLLATLLGADVTGMPGQCASCHTIHVVGTMRAYTRGPGIVVRCPSCTEVVLRIVETPSGTMVDMRGVAALRLARD
jgi:uncharacterized protein DUF6510